jgi:hypothetical protein
MYKLGLKCGGLMEDPDWHIQDKEVVEANSLREAKDKWAEKTYNNGSSWDPNSQTVWGWCVVVLRTNDPSVDKKEFYEF